MPKVGWILLGNSSIGSSRIHGINIHRYINKNGIKSVILQTNSVMTTHLTLSLWKQLLIFLSRFDVLIFQKVFDSRAIRLATLAKKLGVKTVFLQSDMIETKMVNKVDALVVTSDYLKRHYNSKYGVDAILIEDAVEVSDELVKEDYGDKGKIRLIWVGHKDNWETIEVIYNALEILKDDYFCLKRISNHPQADVQWKLETVFQEILQGDIGIIPCFNNEWAKSKSNNRLTMFMALGLPVIASDIPSYRDIIKPCSNGFLAKSIDDWTKYLQVLRDEHTRKKIGMKARKDVWEKYNIDVIGDKWISLVENLCSKKKRDKQLFIA